MNASMETACLSYLRSVSNLEKPSSSIEDCKLENDQQCFKKLNMFTNLWAVLPL
jgi:hypothetical protein